jgi:hypothetical protein
MTIEDMKIGTVQDMLDALALVEDKTVPLVIHDDGDLRDISMVDASIMGDNGKLQEVHINVEVY